jgi:hypothetical protein
MQKKVMDIFADRLWKGTLFNGNASSITAHLHCAFGADQANTTIISQCCAKK